MSGQLFVISAPSGGGKSTIVAGLLERVENLAYSVSHTSRSPRGDEKDGVDYHFIDRKEFQRMIEADLFLEWAEVYNDFYGTSLKSIQEITSRGLDAVLDVDSQGAKNIRNKFKNSVLIYLVPPSIQILEERLRGRGTDNSSTVQERLSKAENEIANCLWYDHIIVNDKLEKAIDETRAVILSERTKTSRISNMVTSLFNRVSGK
jgi:guanylate kinase